SAQILVTFDLRVMLFDTLLHVRTCAAARLDLLQHATQQTTTQRTPGDDAHAIIFAGGDYFQFDGAFIQAVFALLADQPHEVALFGGFVGFGDVPAGEVAAADVQNLAFAVKLFHRLPDFLPGGVAVNVVHLVQIDVIGA